MDPITAFILFNILLPMAISLALGYIFRQRVPGKKPAGKNQYTLPTAMEGRCIPIVGGKRRVEGPNVVTPIIDFVAVPKKIKSDMYGGHTTAAYQYYIGLQMMICQAADGVLQVWAADTCLWPTVRDPTDEAADGTVIAAIDAAQIWGGWKSEGGIAGTMRFQYGGPAQTAATYLVTHLGSEIPASRGFVGAIMERMYVGTVPYLKPLSFLVKRTDISPERETVWYAAKSTVNDDDLNAVHCIREWLTSATIGRGKSTDLIGQSFAAAADTCYTEEMGFSYVWDVADKEHVQDMIDLALEIMDAVLYTNRNTARFELALARNDYTVGELETYGEDDLWVSEFHRPSPSKVPSKTIVMWHDKDSCQSRPAYDDDIALLARQGSEPITQQLDYSSLVCDPDLAAKIAARKQQHVSALGAALSIHCDRRMSHIRPGAVFVLSYPALDIVSMVVRVLQVDYGSLSDGAITMDLMEDVYGQEYTIYGVPPNSYDGNRIENPQGDGFDTIDEDLADQVISKLTVEADIDETGPY